MKRYHLVALAVMVAAVFVLTSIPFHAQDSEQRRGFSISITTPVMQEIVFGRAEIAADVHIKDDLSAIDRVEFYAGDDLIFVDREPPWECVFNFGQEPKSWILRAVAHHIEGPTVSDAIITRKANISGIEEVNRVILWATVTDKDDNLITGLSKEDFRVMEDGIEQQIIDFYPEDRPITLGILLDSSGSMREEMGDVHSAAGSFVETLRPEDSALVIDFDDRVFLIQDLTSDHDSLLEAITSTSAMGSTALYDALHAAYRKIGEIKGRKAFVLLSDGDDTSSQFGYDRVLEEAKANNIIIYGIGIGGGDKRVLKDFPETTGGRAFFVKKASELAGVYERIALELRRQYYITYSTTNETWDGRWMKVDVDVTVPKLKVRARRGYFAVKNLQVVGGI